MLLISSLLSCFPFISFSPSCFLLSLSGFSISFAFLLCLHLLSYNLNLILLFLLIFLYHHFSFTFSLILIFLLSLYFFPWFPCSSFLVIVVLHLLLCHSGPAAAATTAASHLLVLPLSSPVFFSPLTFLTAHYFISSPVISFFLSCSSLLSRSAFSHLLPHSPNHRGPYQVSHYFFLHETSTKKVFRENVSCHRHLEGKIWRF